ncbi:uncharacterized protein LOC141900165 [Tubulanus polymorphus]|uniref:uncharacterized protein LOC141900165 n=1 Tax=Tubulanus polymorphus TaxID=672921 RepID=UPI003DA580F9
MGCNTSKGTTVNAVNGTGAADNRQKGEVKPQVREEFQNDGTKIEDIQKDEGHESTKEGTEDETSADQQIENKAPTPPPPASHEHDSADSPQPTDDQLTNTTPATKEDEGGDTINEQEEVNENSPSAEEVPVTEETVPDQEPEQTEDHSQDGDHVGDTAESSEQQQISETAESPPENEGEPSGENAESATEPNAEETKPTED